MPTHQGRLAALLAQPERPVAVQQHVPVGLLEDITPQTLGTLAGAVIAAQTDVGEDQGRNTEPEPPQAT